MTKNSFLLLLFIIPLWAISQRYDNTWLWGIYPQHQNSANYPYYGNAQGTFDNDTFISKSKYRNMTFSETNCSISDPLEGNLLFYTNGLCVRDTNSQIITNGDSLGYGVAWHVENGGFGGSCPWCMVVIPVPENDSMYKLIYRRYDGVGGQASMCFSDLKITEQGLRLTTKDTKFTNITPEFGGVSACKHANGRDWWVFFFRSKHQLLS